MMTNTPARIGMDTAKSVFQLYGVNENEAVVVRRQLRRTEMIRYFTKLPPTLVAGGPSAKLWNSERIPLVPS